MNDHTSPWGADVGVRELTDTDLVSARSTNMNTSSPDRVIHRMSDAVLAWRDLPTRSAACDYAVRVELAAIIDERSVPFVRQDFDVAYLIPPEGTVAQWLPNEPLDVPTDGYDDEKRNVNFSTAPTVFEMMESAVAEGSYSNRSNLVVEALSRVTRQKK